MAKILVAEDDSIIRDAVMDTLSDAGYDVIGAKNGEVALQLARQEHPDLLLLDVMMPQMDGFEVLKKLREDLATQAMPVVLLTAVTPVEGEYEGMKLGVSHYMTKPFRSENLKRIVRVTLWEAEEAKGHKPNDGRKSAERGSDQEEDASMTSADSPVHQGTDDESDTEAFIKTGDLLIPLEKMLGGGIPRGSLTLVEGATDAGKSVLCQHLIYGSLLDGGSCAYFSSTHTPESLATQMNSIGLDVSKYVQVDNFDVFALPEPAPDSLSGDLLPVLAKDIGLCAQKYKFIVVDAITSLAESSDDKDILGLFSSCKRLCSRGITILLVTNSYAIDENMLMRLRSLCDTNLTLRAEKMRGKLVRVLEASKVANTEVDAENTVTFKVEPEVGMRIIPISRAKV